MTKILCGAALAFGLTVALPSISAAQGDGGTDGGLRVTAPVAASEPAARTPLAGYQGRPEQRSNTPFADNRGRLEQRSNPSDVLSAASSERG